MHKKNVIIVLLVLAAVFSVWLFLQNKESSSRAGKENADGRKVQGQSAWETIKDMQGEVEVAVTPIEVQENAPVWTFEVVMDTHSVELDDDMVAASELFVGDISIKPIAWEGDPAGGHHRAGILKFQPIAPFSSSLTLVMRGVGGVAKRTFVWQLEGR